MKLAVGCSRCRARVIYEQDGPMVITGGKFPDVLCPDCWKTLEEMNNPDLKRGKYLAGRLIVRMAEVTADGN